MDLASTDAQRELLDWAGPILANHYPLERFNALHGHAGTEVEAAALTQLAALGWFGLGLGESAGGAGYSVVEECQLMVAAGRYLPGPGLCATVIAAPLLAAWTGITDPATLPPVALGMRVPGAAAAASVLLFDAVPGQHVLLVGDEAVHLHDAQDLTGRTDAPCLDDSVRVERAHVSGSVVPASPVAPDANFLRAQLLIAAGLIGVGEGALDMAVAYAGLRKQFGKLIGSYQAVAHKCSDAVLQLTAARSQLIYAALALIEERGDAAFQVGSARLLAGSAARGAAYANVQIHGGIGFTQECHAQRFVKRAVLFDSLPYGGARLRDLLLDGPIEEAA